MRLVLALIFFGFALNVAQAADSEGRRMLIFAIYGAAGTTGSAATTTVIWLHAGRRGTLCSATNT